MVRGDALVPCPSCGHPNEPPYLLCEKCGEPRVHLNRWGVTWNLTLTFSTLVASFHFRELLAWNWPLYLLFAIFFTQISVGSVPLNRRSSTRFNLWFAVFLLGFFGIFFLHHREQLGIAFLWLGDLPDIVAERPLISSAILGGALVAVCVPAYFGWGKRYGWVNGYRLVLLSLAGASGTILIFLVLLGALQRAGLLPDGMMELEDFTRVGRPVLEKYLAFFCATTLRILVFEIVVFSALRGVVVTRRRQAVVRAAANDSGFVRSAMGIAHAVNRFLDVLENMLRYVWDTLRVLAFDLSRVVVAFLREVAVPAIALSTAAILCYRMTFWFESYVAEQDLDAFIRFACGIVALLVCAYVFAACKTPFRHTRLVRNLLSTLTWLLPNLLLFFLLLSFTLYASSALLNRFLEEGPALPFRIGVLTQGVAAFLVFLVIVMFLRKRSQLFGASPVEAEAESTVGPPGSGRTRGPQAENEREESKKGIGYLVETVRERSEALGLDKRTDRLKRSARELTDWLRGKPSVVKELEEAKGLRDKKSGQLEALERTRDSISAEAYEGMHTRYEREIIELGEKIDEAQEEIDRLYAEESQEKAQADRDLAESQRRLAEVERLNIAGALDAREARARLAEAQDEVRLAAAKIEVYSRRLVFLAPYAAKGPDAANDSVPNDSLENPPPSGKY
ncbi:hypothetical protein JW916_01870 [Candidatus Sumerlaeota bacterium]|nr:hypothetical protein [Candidatus Sumerlaeota bacterium]